MGFSNKTECFQTWISIDDFFFFFFLYQVSIPSFWLNQLSLERRGMNFSKILKEIRYTDAYWLGFGVDWKDCIWVDQGRSAYRSPWIRFGFGLIKSSGVRGRKNEYCQSFAASSKLNPSICLDRGEIFPTDHRTKSLIFTFGGHCEVSPTFCIIDIFICFERKLQAEQIKWNLENYHTNR